MSDQQQLKKFMKNQTKDVEKIATQAIFTDLPQLYKRIQDVIKQNEYFDDNAVINFYSKMETIFFDLHDSSISHEILKQQFKSTDELLNMAAQINKPIYELTQQVQELIDQATSLLDKILIWLQVLLPKTVQGGSFPEQEVLLLFSTELQKQLEETQQFFDVVTTYHTKRASIIKNLKKQPCFDLYRTIIQLDCKQIRLITDYVINMNIKLLSYYSGLVSNYEKLKRLSSRIDQQDYVQ